jgi:hypothetical protein
MEPHREEQQQALEPGVTPKPKRFRIVKLEDRIAPSKGGNGTHNCSMICPTRSYDCYTQPVTCLTVYC